ncbi:cyclin-like protein [Thelephora terrestris]|uniref:Cyclin-like protein n=1 Tax=Thelephora terrestris TaxID=56493 RepID=A0A9P6HTM4_9AGAM|nr:cyclin-like protein [Thelephora terrestris]
MTLTASSQWLFPVSALYQTPSVQCSGILLQKELYDRSKGIEFLYRLGSTLLLSLSTMTTAATWYHRFYMRNSIEHYPKQEIAAACIFLATKTEECGRKLRDVARVFAAKLGNKDMSDIAIEGKEIENIQNVILASEEALLEVLCFDFWVENVHEYLIDLLEDWAPPPLQDYAWSIAHDSYRTPLCVLFTPRIIASACFTLAQMHSEGPSAAPLDARISTPAPSATLPTPPSYNSTSPNPIQDQTRFAANFFSLTESELKSVAEALTILIQFYASQDSIPHVSGLADIKPPTMSPSYPILFGHLNPVADQKEK